MLGEDLFLSLVLRAAVRHHCGHGLALYARWEQADILVRMGMLVGMGPASSVGQDISTHIWDGDATREGRKTIQDQTALCMF